MTTLFARFLRRGAVRSAATICALVLTATLLAGPATATAAPVRLDPGFGKQGRVALPFDFGLTKFWDLPEVSAEQAPGGKIVVAAGSFIFRLLPDGRLDRSFAGDGVFDAESAFGPRITIDISENGGIRDLAVDGAGGMVAVAGAALEVGRARKGKAAILRLREDGSPDPGFGENGRVVTDFGLLDEAGRPTPWVFSTDVAIDARGGVVVAGSEFLSAPYCTINSGFLARLAPDGSLDLAFGNGGTVAFGRNEVDAVEGFALDRDSILVGGHAGVCKALSEPIYSIRRVSENGALDTSFGAGGFAYVGERPKKIAVDTKGRIVALQSRYVDDGGSSHLEGRVIRFLTSGERDRGFGRDGRTALGFAGSHSSFSDLELTSKGGVVLVGTLEHTFDPTKEPRRRSVLVRLGPAGRPDLKLGQGGRLTSAYGKPSGVAGRSVLLQGDGRAVLVGLVRNERMSTGQGVLLLRYLLK